MIVGVIDIEDRKHFICIILCEECGVLFTRSNYIVKEVGCDLAYCCGCCIRNHPVKDCMVYKYKQYLND